MNNSLKSILSLSPVMPVLVIRTDKNVEYLIEAVIKGNINCVEITLRTSCALSVIKTVSKKFPELTIGAGTIITKDDLNRVEDAGASFAVSPGSTFELAEKAIQMNFPFLPGVATASDILKLLDLEYKYFKFFPAVAAGGIEYINSLKGPFPEIMFCPTGGINQTNAIEWLNLTNVICVGGSWIVPPEITDYNEITNRALFASKLVK